MKILAVIPARGGSKEIPRKNVRILAGKPLIYYSITVAKKSKYITDVVVSTDDDEISKISVRYGVKVVNRPKYLAGDSVTLDPVIYDTVIQTEDYTGMEYEKVITLQPTSPLLSVETLDSAIENSLRGIYDTIISGINDPHLSWKVTDGEYRPSYEKRLNRQYLPKDLREVGAFVISNRETITQKSRIGKSIGIYEVPKSEAIDIDSANDWLLAESELNAKNIVIRVEGYPEIGLGHIYRGIQIANGLIEHNVSFAISNKSDFGIKKLEQHHAKYSVVNSDNEFYAFLREFNADIVVNDILDTDATYIKQLKGMNLRVVNFEDIGDGADKADAVINALYNSLNDRKGWYWGSDYYLIRDEFLMVEPTEFRSECKEVLVIFGGTDPNNLTEKTLGALLKISDELKFHITVILGMGYAKKRIIIEKCARYDSFLTVLSDVKLMTTYMSQADIAISSQGRTMLELAAMGVPTILMSQNEREEAHKFGTLRNGFVNLGMGANVDEEMLMQTIKWLIISPRIRQNMREQMLEIDLKHGLRRVKPIILGDL